MEKRRPKFWSTKSVKGLSQQNRLEQTRIEGGRDSRLPGIFERDTPISPLIMCGPAALLTRCQNCASDVTLPPIYAEVGGCSCMGLERNLRNGRDMGSCSHPEMSGWLWLGFMVRQAPCCRITAVALFCRSAHRASSGRHKVRVGDFTSKWGPTIQSEAR